MEFDDFFEGKQRHHGSRHQGNYMESRYHDDHEEFGYSNEPRHKIHGYDNNQKWFAILDKIRTNKQLKIMVMVSAVVICIIIIATIVALLPLILELIHYVSQNGIQGILDGITGFLDKLWKGSGK